MRIIITLLALVVSVTAQSPLEGEWKNQLGSVATLHANNGTLTGWYDSAVGHVHGRYPLVGMYHRERGRTTLAFSVTWPDANSSTAWAGQLLSTPVIYTQWLLARFVDKEMDLWQSTIVGSDIFMRV